MVIVLLGAPCKRPLNKSDLAATATHAFGLIVGALGLVVATPSLFITSGIQRLSILYQYQHVTVLVDMRKTTLPGVGKSRYYPSALPATQFELKTLEEPRRSLEKKPLDQNRQK
ncbi:hypothetical protein K504DRAFT_501518 [Pleomassaria siparia CBS 279.74]|uniref:Uncharacterized protein n=1 Tax=Pleomassaria siparia CBS 279.74 TaxID=1314801 RepID=A0A6G1KBR4_9PLEO|nr:hypothetical protein K504DRAFT_501518 [Pleomassaria siparia CBS 279.74]